MIKHPRFPLYAVVLFACLFSACQKEIDEYYARPASLEPTIFLQLEAKGQFSSYLALIVKAGYKDILSSAGYFTVFAPTDDAFQPFLQEESLSSLDEIDSLTARKIVAYSLVYNLFTQEQIDDYQSTREQGWIEDKAFRRTTASYKWVYEEMVDGSMKKIIDQNGVPFYSDSDPIFSSNDNNNKNIPYFTIPYMDEENISVYDYNYFFPESVFSGFNVVDASVTEADILCENGIVHATDKVILPLSNIEEILASDENCSDFKKLIDDYITEYVLAPKSFLDRYEQVQGSREDVMLKSYPLLNFGLNVENYMRYGGGETYDTQIDSWTLFAPNNAAMKDFFDNVFLKHYGSLDRMPQALIAEFINAHLFRSTVWPSKFDISSNEFGEPARFDPESNIELKEFGSNGLYYGTNIVQATDAFFTALGPIILNPDYSLMFEALKGANLNYILKNADIRITVFMINNAGFDSLGISYNSGHRSWQLDNPELGTNAKQAVDRMIKLHVLIGEHDDLRADALIETWGGEYIRHSYGFPYAAGNIERSDFLVPSNKTQVSNGWSYVLSSPFQYSISNIGRHIEGKPEFKKFLDYLEHSASSMAGFIYDTDKKVITNISSGDNNTLFIPTNAAMDSAAAHGVIPELGIAYFTLEEQNQLLEFVMYHVVPNVIATNDGKASGDWPTLYSTEDGKAYVSLFNTVENFTLIDNQGRASNVMLPSSNVLSNRAVIHQIDNYLKY